ncbi:hypothetical protein ACHAXS_005485 [Conticribra weissflogii]
MMQGHCTSSEVDTLHHRHRHHHFKKKSHYLIYWRGEHKEEYSQSFRQLEFLSALSATIADHSPNIANDAPSIFQQLMDGTTFANAFSFDPYKRYKAELPALVPWRQVDMYNESLQYVSFKNIAEKSDGVLDETLISQDLVAKASARCSLIHSSYLLVAEGMEYSDLVDQALQSKVFDDMKGSETVTQQNGKTWRLRRHEYGFINDDNNPRFGKGTTRSVQKEKTALKHLEPFLITFKGKVDLKNPECNIYLLEGICDNNVTDSGLQEITVRKNSKLLKILARKLSSGAKVSVMAPKTRICITNTPLEPIAAFILCNLALIGANDKVLDPFAGSASALLAASLISHSVRAVGIEIASEEFLSREKIRQDFSTRGLPQPIGLLTGDSMDSRIRAEARKLIGGSAFDAIVCDPPYGIREAMSGSDSGYGGSAALFDLIDAIGRDRQWGTPLLKRGGKLVCFFPCLREDNIEDLLPSNQRLRRAGLLLEFKREQKLNSALSRWVLSFKSN